MNNYEKQAQDFLDKTQTTFKAEYIKTDFHFDGDKEKRDIYKITLQRGNRKMVFNFGQSIVNSSIFQPQTNYSRGVNAQRILLKRGKAPTPYDILACLQKYEVGSFENFCNEFGYNVDSKKAEKTYNAVLKEWQEVQKLWSDEEITLLQEIN